MTAMRKLLAGAALSTAATLGYLKATTTFISPLDATDTIFASKPFREYNPYRNPTSNDECLKEIPLSRIRPELLKNEGDLVLELCRGIWSSRVGFDVGRMYYYLKWHGPKTASQLWTRQQLSTSTYELGTDLTNHFNVVNRTPNEITIRFGDSPREAGLRPLDGLFVIKADIDRSAGVARLSLKTLVFCGDKQMSTKVVPAAGDYVHSWVARLWMTTGSRRLLL